jgi:hypothetical protein
VYVTPLYFILLILLCSFFILNLTIAIMLDQYEKISSATEDQGMINEIVDMGKQAKLPDKIIDFLVTQDITLKNKKEAFQWSKFKASILENFIYSPEMVVPSSRYYEIKLLRCIYLLVMASFFNSLIFL